MAPATQRVRVISRETDPVTDEQLVRVCNEFLSDYERFSARDCSEESVVHALAYYSGYPMYRMEVGEIKNTERYKAYWSLNRTHIEAARLLLWEAEQYGLNAAPVVASARICQRIFEHEPGIYNIGPSEYWPQCLGPKLQELDAHERGLIEAAEEAIERLMVRGDPQWRQKSPAQQQRSVQQTPRVRRRRHRTTALPIAETEDRERILERWTRAKRVGVSQKEFARDQGISVIELNRIVNWAAQRRARKR